MTGTGEAAAVPGAGAPLPPEVQRALEGLRDLQTITVLRSEPQAVAMSGGTIVSAGFLLACALLLAAALAAAAFAWWRRRFRRELLAELHRLRGAAADAATPRHAEGIERLLRRAAAAGEPRARCPACPPGLAGDAWLAWLDTHAPAADRGRFLAGSGRLLGTLPFAREAAPLAGAGDAAELGALCERWLRANLR